MIKRTIFMQFFSFYIKGPFLIFKNPNKFLVFVCFKPKISKYSKLSLSSIVTFFKNVQVYVNLSLRYLFSFYAFRFTAMGLQMEGSPGTSGSKSNTHCSGFGQITHERDLAFFPTGTYKLQGLGCRYKMAQSEITMKVTKKIIKNTVLSLT